MPSALLLASAAVLPFLLLCAAISDVRSFTIPNWQPAALLAGFGLAALAFGLPPVQIGWHLSAAVAMLVVGFGLFVLRVWGGGDAKLLAAVAAWTGWAGLMPLLFWMALAGGILAAIALVRHRLRIGKRQGAECDGQDQPPRVPYGVAIAVGGIHALISGKTLVGHEFFLSMSGAEAFIR